MKNKEVLVTGGAGFIGSHLVDSLKENNEITVYDNFSSAVVSPKPDVTYIKADILDLTSLTEHLEDVDIVFHFAANPSVRKSTEDPIFDFKQNVRGTLNVLEAMRRNGVPKIVFASSSTVYGEAKTPTPESYPLKPISNYGASKAACELYIKSYSSLYGIKGIVLRYANIFGPRSNHGVMYDFYHKLKKNPNRLEILGDGNQKKSYLYITDCIQATLASLKTKKDFDIFNIGSEEQIIVNQIAKIICDELNLNPKFEYTGGRRGWKGDVPLMLLDLSKIKKLGWKPTVTTEQGIRKYIKWLQEEIEHF